MKKYLTFILVIMLSISMYSQTSTYIYRSNRPTTVTVTCTSDQSYRVATPTTTYRTTQESDYYLDRWLENWKDTKHPIIGLMTRFGYSYNDDSFMYGASMYYHGGRLLGVTAGFDGYCGGKLPGGMPEWDIRLGLLLGQHFACGVLAGKCSMVGCKDESGHITISENKNLWGSKVTEGIYGGFATFIMPVSKYFAMNLDLALTNHTGFNVSLGVNAYLPIK